MATSGEGGRYQARRSEGRDLELTLDVGEGRREAILNCLEKGELRMVLQDVDLDQLAGGDLGGGYLWD